jgi:hypothetical protein
MGISKCTSDYGCPLSVGRLNVCIYIPILKQCVQYYEVGNLVTVTKMNMIGEMPWVYGNQRSTAVRIQHQTSHGAAQWSLLLSKSSTYLG